MIATIWNTIFYFPVFNLTLCFYNILFDNLGLAIIAIAVILRLILIPLTRRQTEMTRKMANMKPQIDELQKKFKNNPERLSQEQIKLYKKIGYNPLGCLVTFLPQLLVLSVLIQVIRHITNGDFDGIYPFVREWIFGNGDIFIETKFLLWDLARQFKGSIDEGELAKITEFIKYSPWQIIDMHRAGEISNELMSIIYKYGISNQYGITSAYSIYYILLAALVGVSQYFSTIFTQKIQSPSSTKKSETKKGEEMSPEQLQQKMMGSMTLIFPFMAIFIAIGAPAALSLYWIVQSVMLIIQYMLLDWDKTKVGVQNLITEYKGKIKK